MGQNKIGSIPREIATFLGLLEPPLYTGHCFRRTSATLLAESGADLLSLKRHGGWKSNSVVEGYIEDSIQSKSKICNSIVEAITLKEPLSDSWSRPSTSKMSPHKIGNNSPLSPTFTPIESNESAQLFKITDTSSLPQNSAQFTNTNITLPNKNIKLNIISEFDYWLIKNFSLLNGFARSLEGTEIAIIFRNCELLNCLLNKSSAFNLYSQSSIAARTRSMSISAAALIKDVLSDSKLG
ncbi:hypothetical protein evm_001587 [Chilo suppressalis]|nr:hypothetical protein evm_001587 [Chilo suppressalis]